MTGAKFGIDGDGNLTVQNYGGTIGANDNDPDPPKVGDGIFVLNAGLIKNGNAGDPALAGVIYGYYAGIFSSTEPARIVNVASIAQDGASGAAIVLLAGGTVTKGTNPAGAGLGVISGENGILAKFDTTIANCGDNVFWNLVIEKITSSAVIGVPSRNFTFSYRWNV